MSSDKCVRCNYNTKKTKFAYKNRRQLSGSSYTWHREALQKEGRDVSEQSFLCNKCRCKMSKLRNRPPVQEAAQLSNMTVPLENISQAGKSKGACVICRMPYKSGTTITIPSNARLDLLIMFNMFVAEGCVICLSHLDKKNLKADTDMPTAPRKQSAELASEDASDVIQQLLGVIQTSRERPYLDFLDPSMSDEDFITWTGWNKQQFNDMLEYLIDMRSTSVRDKASALAMFWVKLKTGLSFAQICTLFNLHPIQQVPRVAEAIHTVSEQLVKYFVHEYIGVGSMTREDAISHATTYAKTFFGVNRVISIWDGTYFYIQKSGDHEIARKTYSVHKGRQLIKFMSIVLPDGYVLDTIGPFYSDGKNNDAGMTRYIIEYCNTFIDWLQEEDVTVLDRGFRDVIDAFETIGIECKMPAYLCKGLSQHPTEEANQSRLVTKVRWAVEAYHGRLKKWKFFYNVIDNHHIPHMKNFVTITSAAMNAYRPPLTTDKPQDQAEADLMLQSASRTTNMLKTRVQEGALSSRGGKWVCLDAEGAAPNFPHLDEDYLRSLTYGVYQLKQAKHYSHEHCDDDGSYRIEVHDAAPDLLRVRMQSRHISSKRYFLWIQYTDNDNDIDPVKCWYCQCKAGERVVGCCAHVSSVVWYLGLARHLDQPLPKKRDIKHSLMNAASLGPSTSNDVNTS